MKHPMCASCGHQKAKHVESVLQGHVICVSRGCGCTLFQLPKDGGGPSNGSAMTPRQVGEMIRESTAAGLRAAEEKFPVPCGMCAHDDTIHFRKEDHAKQQAQFPCRDCSCSDFIPGGTEESLNQAAQKLADHLFRAKSHEPVGNYHPEEDIDELHRKVASGEMTQNQARRAIGLRALPALENDPVNHPTHYTAYPGIEVIQLTRHMSFNRGNAVKYVARAGLKNKDTEVQDLEKAIWYLQDEVKLLKGEYEDNG